jgi:Iodothyronine deiodinase
LQGGEKKLLKIPQTEKVEDRAEVAKQCVDTLRMTLPTLIDRADNQVNTAYGAWPDRLYIIGVDGKIAYQGGPGPGGFRVNEIEKWLRVNTMPKGEK